MGTRCPDGMQQPQCPQTDSEEIGRKLVFDNLDYTQDEHWMTEEHQNVDCRCHCNKHREQGVWN